MNASQVGVFAGQSLLFQITVVGGVLRSIDLVHGNLGRRLERGFALGGRVLFVTPTGALLS
jgi:hypothetical protein